MKPQNISVSLRRLDMSITWDDGHESIYPQSLLRYACPCAECRGGHINMRKDPDPDVFTHPLDHSPASTIQRVNPIGAYAIGIEWQDGHHHGIYTWAYLRALCPCPFCRGEIALR